MHAANEQQTNENIRVNEIRLGPNMEMRDGHIVIQPQGREPERRQNELSINTHLRHVMSVEDY